MLTRTITPPAVIVLLCLCAGAAQAQPRRPSGPPPGRTPPILDGERTGVTSKPGAPFSAEGLTVMTQTLADGNRLERRSTSVIHRDSAGRLRQEMDVSVPGLLPFGEQAPRIVSITDPVAGSVAVLDDRNRTAFVRKLPPPVAGTAEGPGRAAPDTGPTISRAPRESKTEDLGLRMIEGLEARGTRSTVTIKAGTIGNERDIIVESERWVSTELGVALLITRKDARFGDSVYGLGNIVRGDPDAELFVVPADYAVKGASELPLMTPRMPPR